LALAFAWTGQTLAQTVAKPAAPKTPGPIKKTGNTHAGEAVMAGGTLVITNGPGWQVPATLEQALKEAMDNNSTIVTAKTKVIQAEADLNTKRMDVARKLVQTWVIYQQQKLQFEQAVAAKNQIPGGVQDAWIVENAGQMSVCEMELRSIIGQSMASAPRAGGTATATTFPRSPKPVQLPRGPVVEKIRNALFSPAQLDFTETPLQDLVDYLKSVYKIEIQLDRKALEDINITGDTPISIKLKAPSLGAALQAFDDQFPEIRIVVRDYGLLVTSPERAREQGYFPVVDFARAVNGSDEFHQSGEMRPVMDSMVTQPIMEAPMTPLGPPRIRDSAPRIEPLPTQAERLVPHAPEATPTLKQSDETPHEKSLPTPAERKPAKEHDPFQ
jgi:hypothetical protein